MRKTGRLADDFHLMGHDEKTGAPYLGERILGLGLAGALLSELVTTGAAFLRDGLLAATGKPGPPDHLAAGVLQDLQDENPLPVRDWLAYLAPDAPRNVARRLEAEGLLTYQRPRIPLPGVSGRWQPTDPITAGWPAVYVQLKVAKAENGVEPHAAMLFGLTRATALNHPSLYEVRSWLHDGARLEQVLAPLRPELRALLAHTEEAVRSAVTSQRH